MYRKNLHYVLGSVLSVVSGTHRGSWNVRLWMGGGGQLYIHTGCERVPTLKLTSPPITSITTPHIFFFFFWWGMLQIY